MSFASCRAYVQRLSLGPWAHPAEGQAEFALDLKKGESANRRYDAVVLAVAHG